MQYGWRCLKCHTEREVSRSVEDRDIPEICECGTPMIRDAFPKRLIGVRADYNEPIVSESMAFDSCDIAEHRKRFPNVEVQMHGRIANPVLRNLSQKRAYMKARNFVDQNSFV